MNEPWLGDPVVGQESAAVSVGDSPWEKDPVVPLDQTAGGRVRIERPGYHTQRDEAAPWHSTVTGAGRTEFPDAPELGTSGPSVPAFSEQGMRMMGAYALSTDDKQIQDIAVDTLKDAKPKEDKYGNAMVEFGGKDYYVNKPGISTADLFQLTGQAGAYAPSARIGAAAKTLPMRMLRTGGMAAPTSVATDLASEELGSKQGVDYLKAGIAGVAGGLFEGLTPLAVRAWRGIFRNNRLFNAKTGELTEEGEKIAREADLDPDTMTERLAQEFAEEARDATDPKHAAGRVQGKEFDIPYTKGQASQDVTQIGKEEATRHGAFGDEAGDIVRSFDDAQQTRMQGARGQVQSTVAGGERTIAKPSQAGDTVAEGVQTRAQRLGQQIDDAYEEVRGTDARLTARSFRGLARRVTSSVRESFDLHKDINPFTMRAIGNLAKVERQVTKRSKSGAITGVAFRAIETERRKINNLISSAAGSDRTALTRIKNSLDDWIDEAFDNALFTGDPAALQKMKDARSLRTKFGELYEPKNPQDVAGKVVQKILQDETITPEQVVNNIFGRRGLGQKDASVQIVERIKRIVGEDSPDWSALKEAAWLRLSKEIGTDTLSPRKFATKFNTVMDENQSLMETLFSPDEMSMMQRFRDDVMRTVSPDKSTNPPRTAYTLARLAREWMGRLGTMLTFSGSPVGGALFFTMKRIPQVMGKRGAKQAVGGLRRMRPGAPYLTAPATGAAALGAERLPTTSRR